MFYLGLPASGKTWTLYQCLRPLQEAQQYVNRYLKKNDYFGSVNGILCDTFSGSSVMQKLEETKESGMFTSDEIGAYVRAFEIGNSM